MVDTTDKKSKSHGGTPQAWSRESVLRDFRLVSLSREASIIARKEVLAGRANFGIIGDGKEVAQVAMAHAWQPGDFRSGYYRDQTLALALEVCDLDSFFAQLYGDCERDPFSGGRQMNCHFATPFNDEVGGFLDLKSRFNISSDIAPTGGQMARALGLAFASKKFREFPELSAQLSDQGNEVTFCTIGDASTSEGAFWETINAAGVLQVPLAVSVWDDGFGISVPKKYQTTKENISEVLAGFQAGASESGIDLYIGKAWDYPGLVQMYQQAIAQMRETHRPAVFHIQEVTQQLGHSTSGDHRRYKTPERLAWEEEYDCNRRMAEWIVSQGLASEAELEEIRKETRQEATQSAQRAFRAYHGQVQELRSELLSILEKVSGQMPEVGKIANQLAGMRDPLRFELIKAARRVQFFMAGIQSPVKQELADFIDAEVAFGRHWYSKHLYSETEKSALKVPAIPPVFTDNSPVKDGFEVLNACFDANFSANPAVFAFGEDVGFIGDVNQGLRGMQAKYGEGRVFDTGIREWTIMGQAIGMAMRGLRPIAEIQYLDYLLYGLSPLSDDLATLRWRSNNLQSAPAIIRTRGHRLVGVWHSGSPMSMMLGSLRGMWICVPRNMTQAAGMYNTLLRSDDPGIVVECLNGYRLKEKLPDNIGTFTVPLGQPEILLEGRDVTVITYGSCVRIAEEAAELLHAIGIEIELIDVQTLLPFDLGHRCVESLKKTNRVVFMDEDVPGGASAFLMQQVLEVQKGYQYLDAHPITLSAQEHRPAYGQDGDYFSKPQAEDLFEAVYRLVRETEPSRLPSLEN